MAGNKNKSQQDDMNRGSQDNVNLDTDFETTGDIGSAGGTADSSRSDTNTGEDTLEDENQ